MTTVQVTYGREGLTTQAALKSALCELEGAESAANSSRLAWRR